MVPDVDLNDTPPTEGGLRRTLKGYVRDSRPRKMVPDVDLNDTPPTEGGLRRTLKGYVRDSRRRKMVLDVDFNDVDFNDTPPTEGGLRRTLKGYVRDSRRRKMVLDVDFNDTPPTEERALEEILTGIVYQGAQSSVLGGAFPPATTIDVDAIDDEVVISSPRSFAEARNKSRRNHGVTVVLDEESDVNQGNSEIQKMHQDAQSDIQRIFLEHQKLKGKLESQMRNLEQRVKELEKREAQNETERKLQEDREKNAKRNSSLQKTTLEQKKADENVPKLADDHQRQKEELHKRILYLEKQLVAKHALELEIQRLKGTLEVMKYMRGEDDAEVQKKMESMMQELEEKTGDLEDLELMNRSLIVKERNSNDELQEARKELIDGLKEMSGGAQIGIKRMGDLDIKPFIDACKQKYSAEEADVKAVGLCSEWDEHLRNPAWYPFRIILRDGKPPQEIIDEEDEKLKSLKNDLGDQVYMAVVTALKEINEYNPSGRSIIHEVWNFKEGRKASLKEGVAFILNQWRTHKRMRLTEDGMKRL